MIARPPVSDFFRPNFFTNTPDILHAFLQQGGRPAFEIRLVLAAHDNYEIVAVPDLDDGPRWRLMVLKNLTSLPAFAGDCLHRGIAEWFEQRRDGRAGPDARWLFERAREHFRERKPVAHSRDIGGDGAVAQRDQDGRSLA